MLAGKTLLDYTNLFSVNDFKKNDKIIYKYFKEKYQTKNSRLKKIDETKNYFFEEIKRNELMSKKHKKMHKTLNYLEPALILTFALAGVFQFLFLLN